MRGNTAHLHTCSKLKLCVFHKNLKRDKCKGQTEQVGELFSKKTWPEILEGGTQDPRTSSLPRVCVSQETLQRCAL